MKFRNILGLLAIFVVLFCAVQPVLADDNTTTDVATSFFDHGVQALVSKDYTGAIALFDRALASNTTMIRMSDAALYLYQNKAYALIQLERYPDALATTNEGLAAYGEDPILWNNKGYVLYNTGQYQQALDAYNTALRFKQNYTMALINKGDTLQKLGRFPDAIDAYNAALAEAPGSPAATAGIERAQSAAASTVSPELIVAILAVVVFIGGGVYFLKFRKPAAPKSAAKKAKGKNK